MVTQTVRAVFSSILLGFVSLQGYPRSARHPDHESVLPWLKTAGPCCITSNWASWRDFAQNCIATNGKCVCCRLYHHSRAAEGVASRSHRNIMCVELPMSDQSSTPPGAPQVG